MPGYQLSETNHHEKVYPVSPEWGRPGWTNRSTRIGTRRLSEPTAFWSERGCSIDWFKPFTKVKNTSFGPGEVFIRWFEDGATNVAYNCIDWHLDSRGDRVAIIWASHPAKDRRERVRKFGR
jgi:acetyl-CoA synthetase